MNTAPLRPHELGAVRTHVSAAHLPHRHLLDVQRGAIHYVASEGDAPIGVISAFPVDERGRLSSDHWRIWGLAVAPSHTDRTAAVAALLAATLRALRAHERSSHAPLTLTAPDELSEELTPHGFTLEHTVLKRELPAEPCPADDGYCPRCVRVLDFAQVVRKRPAMYLGAVDARGLAAGLKELVGNVIDLHLAGSATRLSVALDADGWTVSDDGPAFPIRREPGDTSLSLTQVMTAPHFQATRDGRALHTHIDGLSVGGLCALNALSATLTVTMDAPEGRFTQRFGRGRPLSFLKRLGPPMGRGTTLQLRPDPEIFGTARLTADDTRAWLQDVAWLNPGLEVWLQGRRLRGGDGLPDMLKALAGDAPLRGLLLAAGELDGIRVRAAVGWVHPSLSGKSRIFANQGELTEGGTPALGLARGLLGSLAGGRLAVVDVLLTSPRYVGPTRGALSNPAAAEAVAAVVGAALPGFLETHPELVEA